MTGKLYFIALIPGELLREKIKRLKLEIKDRFGARHALKSPAHITLQMPFRMDETTEEKWLSVLSHLAKRQTPFDVKLSGFGCFAPRVIYVKVAGYKEIIGLFEQLKQTLAENPVLSGIRTTKELHPHMTLATRDLTKEMFELAWPGFKDRSFEDTFTAQSFFLLKHNGKYWDIYREFSFLSG